MQAVGRFKAPPRFDALRRSVKTPLSSAGFNWEFARPYTAAAAAAAADAAYAGDLIDGGGTDGSDGAMVVEGEECDDGEGAEEDGEGWHAGGGPGEFMARRRCRLNTSA